MDRAFQRIRSLMLRGTFYSVPPIGLRLELKAPLTFYVARHSWASIAQDRKVSTDIIREGLGHDNEKTTHIYLASISTSQIDRANQIILKGL